MKKAVNGIISIPHPALASIMPEYGIQYFERLARQ